MATSVVFDLIDRLVVVIRTALPAANVYDGYGETDDPGDFIMVGVSDPDEERAAPSASGRQSWVGIGARSRDEVGTVTCVAGSWNGNPDGLAQARAAVKVSLAAIENALRTDPDLGGTVAGLMWTGFGDGELAVEQLQASDGTSVICRFDIAFKARI